MRLLFFGAVIVAMCLGATTPLEARSLESVKVVELARLPAVNPDWPIPAEHDQLFYVQRSTNSNTIVYTANFGADGLLKAGSPISAYWRRYNTNGARKALSFIEAQFGFGLTARRTSDPAVFAISPKALSKITMQLHQIAPGKAEMRVLLGGRMVRLVYAYVSIDESGIIARVSNISVHGIELATGRTISETFRVSGGEILQ